MTEQLVSFQTAKLAKEKGFKLNFCRELFYPDPNNEGKFIPTELIHDWELIENKEWYSRPTQSLLQKWLREKYDIHLNVIYHSIWKAYVFTVTKIRTNLKSDYSVSFDRYYDTYEEALEQALQEALNLINK